MDTTNGQNNNGTTINNSPTGSSSRPPAWVWVLVALASALTAGVVLYGIYTFITRRRRAKRQQGDADGDVATRGGGSSSPPTWRLWNRRRRHHRSHSQPGGGAGGAASRWVGWVHPHHRPSTTQSSEGLNELGEAPPPYNEDDLEPCLNNMSMVEVNAGLGLSGGPSRVASRQDRTSRVVGDDDFGDFDLELQQGPQQGQQQQQAGGHPEPPAYDFAVNLGTATTTTITSVQPPPPAIVVSEARGA